MARIQNWHGKTKEEVAVMDIADFTQMIPSRSRRKIKRGFTEMEKILLKDIAKSETVKTHCRDMVILPSMLDKKIDVYSGKVFTQVHVTLDMLGHRLGEFVMTRSSVKHSAPGIGATRSSAAISVK